MGWLVDYWWFILLVLTGILINSIKALYLMDVSNYLKNRLTQSSHWDNNVQWDDEDDWAEKK
ncbi:MAG: hypothetical protein FKGGLIKP_00480 [Sodalis sp. Fse]|nr:MAG: hypothetical protein CMIDDMOC_00218 [Sodalis sp. Fle]UVK77865.1 MAG: hypothetical protein FKGGLIKP_00480 [Sodalis sp. Fse]UVK78603.1 MAG: hypothetical protein IGNPGNKH_00060 [Sodalis sp. Ffu]